MTPTDVSNLTSAGDDAPIVRYVNSLIEQAIQSRASDLHLEPTETDMRVRFRIDGVLHEVDKVPHGVQSALVSRLKIMSNVDITERRVPQNGRITVRLNNRNVDLRTATLPTVWGEKVVLRVLDTGGIDLELKKLGFTEAQPRTVRRVVPQAARHGAGHRADRLGQVDHAVRDAHRDQHARGEHHHRRGSGRVPPRAASTRSRSTTRRACTFAAVLPAILRSDPDIVLIGEIRDRPTAQIAVEAALTGHLVLSTLHTNDAPSAITRLIEMGIEPFLVGSSLDCVLAQRLSRRLCEWCKQAYEPTADDLATRWPSDDIEPPADVVASRRLPVLRQHRLSRPAGDHRGHAGVRGDRAASRSRMRRRARSGRWRRPREW